MRRTLTFISIFALLVSMLAVPSLADTVYEPPLGQAHTGPGGNCFDSITIDGVEYDGTKLDGNPRGTFLLEDGVSIIVEANSVTAIGGTAILCIKGAATNSGTVVIADGQTVTYTDGGISNIVWYLAEGLPVFPEGTLGVVKTAAGAYDRTVTWDITKDVEPDFHRLMVGASASSDYEVDVTKSELEDNYRVFGDIEITWSGSDATVTITSVVDSIAGTDITCPATTIAPNSSITCTYVASVPDDTVTENTATVAGSYVIPAGFQNAGDTVPVGSEDTSPPFTYLETLIGFDEVSVVDAFAGGAALELAGSPISDSFLFEYDRTFVCAERGTFTYPNTATIVETEQSDSALVTVECVAAMEACTPGFWGGTRTSAYTPANQPAWDYLGTLGITVDSEFADSGLTYNQIFNTEGRASYAGSLVWHAAAAYLNATMAAEGFLDWPLTPAAVLDLYEAGDKDALADANEDGLCPFGASSVFSPME